MNINILKHILTIVFLFFLLDNINNIYSQEWVQNKITDYFRNDFILDFGLSKDALWVLSKHSDYAKNEKLFIVKCKNDKINKYYINHVSSGSLEKFIDSTVEDIGFFPTSLLVGNNKIWIIDEIDLKCAVIQNDSIRFFNFNSNNINNVFSFEYIIDDYNNIMIINKYKNPLKKQKRFEIFYSNGNSEFIEYNVPIELESNSYLEKIIFHNNLAYYISGNDLNNLIIYLYEDGRKYKKSLQIYNSSIISSFINDDKIFLFCFEKKYPFASYILVSDLDLNLINKFSLPKLFGYTTCSYFVSTKNNAYVSDGSGFYKFNYTSKNLLKIEEKVSKEFFGNTFRRLKIKDNIIYGCYDGFNDLINCQLLSDEGLYLYKMEE